MSKIGDSLALTRSQSRALLALRNLLDDGPSTLTAWARACHVTYGTITGHRDTLVRLELVKYRLGTNRSLSLTAKGSEVADSVSRNGEDSP